MNNMKTTDKTKAVRPVDLLPAQMQAAARLFAAVVARKLKAERDEAKG
jgi:hypothetical protein